MLLTIEPTSVVQAQTMFMGYTASVQLFNIAGSSTNITLTFYNPDGTTQASVTDTLQGNQSKTYFPVTSTGNSFKGSMKATSSSQNIVSIANIVAPGSIAAAAVVGKSTGSTTVRLPLLNKNNGGFFTWFSVQNTGNSSANVSVQYSDNTNTSYNNLAAGAARTFYQANESHDSANFAAQITSAQPLVATVIQETPRVMLAYTGFTNAGPTLPVFPLVNTNNTGYVTGIQLQNNGSSSTNVTVSYQPSTAGTACTETQTIDASAVKTFALYVFDSDPNNNTGITTNCVAGQTFIGSAKVTTNSTSKPLAGIINQLNSNAFKAGAYTAFDVNAATHKVVFPLIMDRNGGYYTGFNVQHVGGSTSQVTCTFTNSSYTASANLSSGQSLNDIQLNKIANGYVGSATCTAANTGVKLVGVANQLGPGAAYDRFLVYEGINIP